MPDGSRSRCFAEPRHHADGAHELRIASDPLRRWIIHDFDVGRDPSILDLPPLFGRTKSEVRRAKRPAVDQIIRGLVFTDQPTLRARSDDRAQSRLSPGEVLTARPAHFVDEHDLRPRNIRQWADEILPLAQVPEIEGRAAQIVDHVFDVIASVIVSVVDDGPLLAHLTEELPIEAAVTLS